MERYERIVRAIAPSGNLFLLVSLPELRRQGLTYLAFYALQRAVELEKDRDGPYSEHWLRWETGLEDFETSRACRLLEKSGLVNISRAAADRRLREIEPTDRGHRILNSIMETAGERLSNGINIPGRIRRTTEARELLRRANKFLRDPLRPSKMTAVREMIRRAVRILSDPIEVTGDSKAIELLQRANKILKGPLQLSFFDKDLFWEERERARASKRSAKRSGTKSQGKSSRRRS